MKTLLVYYSLEGNTEYAAKKIADQIGADTLRLVPVKPYRKRGLLKFARGGREAMTGKMPELEPYSADFSRYERIVLGFPVWASNVASPMRTFISQNKAKIRRKEIAAFACQGGNGAEKALARLRKLLGIATFEATAVFVEPKKKHSAETDEAIEAFCGDLYVPEVEPEDILEESLPLLKKVGAAMRALPDGRMRDYFSHWNYRKHAKFCTAVYLGLYAFDMTVSYFICKGVLDKLDETRDQTD